MVENKKTGGFQVDAAHRWPSIHKQCTKQEEPVGLLYSFEERYTALKRKVAEVIGHMGF